MRKPDSISIEWLELAGKPEVKVLGVKDGRVDIEIKLPIRRMVVKVDLED